MDLFSLLSPGEHGQKEAKKRRTEVMAMGIAEEDDGANAEDERGEAEDTYSEQAPYFGRTSWHKTSTGATSSGTAGDRWSPASLAAMPKVGIAARVAGSSSAAYSYARDGAQRASTILGSLRVTVLNTDSTTSRNEVVSFAVTHGELTTARRHIVFGESNVVPPARPFVPAADTRVND